MAHDTRLCHAIIFSYYFFFAFLQSMQFAFMSQVANFEYIDEEKAKEEARRKAAAEAANSERAGYWEQLLKDRYDVQKVEEHTNMGKGKRSRKQVHITFMRYHY
jgi:DNA-binding protein H-NS